MRVRQNEQRDRKALSFRNVQISKHKRSRNVFSDQNRKGGHCPQIAQIRYHRRRRAVHTLVKNTSITTFFSSPYRPQSNENHFNGLAYGCRCMVVPPQSRVQRFAGSTENLCFRQPRNASEGQRYQHINTHQYKPHQHVYTQHLKIV